jgi:heme A synthase
MPLVTALATMLLAQLLDLITFVVMVHRIGPQAEVNPVVSTLLGAGGVGEVVFAKVALIVLVGAVAVALRSGREPGMRRAAGVLLGCAIVAGIFGGWTNAITIGPL